VEPGASSRPELAPSLQLDELLAELQGRLQAVLATRDRMRGLLEAVVAIGSGLDLESTLRRIVQTAVGLVDATYGALGVIGDDKRLAEFIPVGLSQDEIEHIHHWPEGRGLLGLLIEDPRALRLADITRQALGLSGADLAVLALPDEEGRRLTITHAEGDGAAAARGLVLQAAQSLSGQVLSTGEPVTSADFAADERASKEARGAMSQIGPAVVFPLGAPGNVRGVLTIGRRHGAAPFPQAQADVVASFAAQAGVALELAARRADAQQLSLYEDRDRIARDLHDLVIQRLYATGMSLEGTLPMVGRPEIATRISNAVDAMDETIKDIRATIFQLQARDDADRPDLRADVLALVEEMTSVLGFAPSLRMGAGLSAEVSREVAEQALAALREALSNAARHSGASQVDVMVDVDPDGILAVQVTDNGNGLPPEGRRSGLSNLAGRADKLGGELRLSPADPGAARPGTRLEWRVPCS